jgi:hypothetical protein
LSIYYWINTTKGYVMSKKKDKDYLSNKEMYQEIIECQDRGTISDKLGRMFMLLSRRYATKPNFSGYSYKDELISAGITASVAAFMKFKREKTQNPFSYFTQVIHTAFLQVLNKEKRHQEIRDSLLVANDMTPSNSYIEKYTSKPGLDEYDEVIEGESEEF